MPFIIMTIVYRPYQRGVYCDDETIRYPYRPDTISHKMMAAVTISCSIIIVSLSANHWSAHQISDSFLCKCSFKNHCNCLERFYVKQLQWLWNVLCLLVSFLRASCSERTLLLTQYDSSQARVQFSHHESFMSDRLILSLTFHLLWFPGTNLKQNRMVKYFNIPLMQWSESLCLLRQASLLLLMPRVENLGKRMSWEFVAILQGGLLAWICTMWNMQKLWILARSKYEDHAAILLLF